MPNTDDLNGTESSISVYIRQNQALQQRLTVLEAIFAVVLHYPLQEQLLRELIQTIQRVMAVDNVAILLPTPDGKNLTLHTVIGPEESIADTVLVPIGHGIAGKIMATGESLVIDDLAQSDVINPLLREQMHSLIGVPLRLETCVVGVLHVSTRQPRHFGQVERDLLALVADCVAVALDRAKVYTTLQMAIANADKRMAEQDALFESITDGVVVYDRMGHIQKRNSTTRLLFPNLNDHVTCALTQRMAIYQITDAAGHPLPIEALPLTHILQGHSIPQDAPMDICVCHDEGPTVQISCTGAPLRDQHGDITGGVIVWRDVTDLRRAEQNTSASFHALIQMARILITTDDNDQVGPIDPPSFREIVAMIHTITGYYCVSITGIDATTEQLHLLVSYGMPPAAEAYWLERRDGVTMDIHFGSFGAQQLRSNQPVILDMRHPPYADRPNPYGAKQFLVLPLMSRDHLYGLLSLATNDETKLFTTGDIQLGSAIGNLLSLAMERKQLRQQHEQAIVALRATRAENVRVQEATRLKSEFLANMSHELRTPLTSIIGFADLLASKTFGVTDVEHKEYVSDILVSAQHLLHLINDILDLAKIEAGKITFRPEAAQMADVVREVQSVLQPLITQKHLQFDMKLDPKVTAISLDVPKLKQIFFNFLSNAIKFTPEGGTVSIDVRADGPYGFIGEITDNGIGISAADLPLLFTAFHQLDAGMAKKYQGSGLGLALTKQLVEAHGGHIVVRSVPGQGSTFAFSLPRRIASSD